MDFSVSVAGECTSLLVHEAGARSITKLTIFWIKLTLHGHKSVVSLNFITIIQNMGSLFLIFSDDDYIHIHIDFGDNQSRFVYIMQP